MKQNSEKLGGDCFRCTFVNRNYFVLIQNCLSTFILRLFFVNNIWKKILICMYLLVVPLNVSFFLVSSFLWNLVCGLRSASCNLVFIQGQMLCYLVMLFGSINLTLKLIDIFSFINFPNAKFTITAIIKMIFGADIYLSI